MACETFADANDFESYWDIEVDLDMEADINRRLELAASNIHIAMLSVDACDCSMSATAEAYVKMLNLVLQAVLFPVNCGPELDDGDLRRLSEWANEQLDQIKTRKIELCDGETGSAFPSVGYFERSSTPFAAVDIIVKGIMRNRG